MPTTPECLCCKELDNSKSVDMLKEARMADENVGITQYHDFQYVVLLEAVLRAVLVARFDIRADLVG